LQPTGEPSSEDKKLEELKSKLKAGQIKIGKKVNSLHDILPPSSPELSLLPKKYQSERKMLPDVSRTSSLRTKNLSPNIALQE
jgi:hypothetical protein